MSVILGSSMATDGGGASTSYGNRYLIKEQATLLYVQL